MRSKHLNHNKQSFFFSGKILFSFSPKFVSNEKSSHLTAASESSWTQASQRTATSLFDEVRFLFLFLETPYVVYVNQ